MSIKKLNFWFGLLFGAEHNTRFWDAITGDQVRLASRMSDRPLLMGSPSSLSILGSIIQVGGWRAVDGLGHHLFDSGGPTALEFSEATHGSLLGSTTPSVGEQRWVIVSARYIETQEVDVIDLSGFPQKQETHHGIQYRILMGSSHSPASPSLGVPPDLNSEVEGGSVILALILRTETADYGYQTLISAYGSPSIQKDQMRKLNVPTPGTTMFKDPTGDNRTLYGLSPTDDLTIVTIGGGAYGVKLTTESFEAHMTTRVITEEHHEVDGDSGIVSVNSISSAGKYLLRLMIDDVASPGVFPLIPRLYFTTEVSSQYPSNTGDDWQSYPSTLRDGTQPYPSTGHDIVLAEVDWDAVSPLELTDFTSVYNPPSWSDEFDIVEDVSGSPTHEVELTLPYLIGRKFLVNVEYLLDEMTRPADRDHPHGVWHQVTFQNHGKVGITIKGEWFDTSGSSISTPGSTRYFRPPCKVRVQALCTPVQTGI